MAKSFEIVTKKGDIYCVSADYYNYENSFVCFYRKEEALEEVKVRRGVWPFGYTQTLYRKITLTTKTESFATNEIFSIKEEGDD